MELSIKDKFKQLLNHGLIYGLTSSLQNVLGFVLLPILTSYYSPAEFGVYSIIILASALASAIFFFGASSALGRFYYEEDSIEFRKKIISSALLITFLGAVLLIVLSILFRKPLSIWLFNGPEYSLHLCLALSGAAFGFLLNIMTLVLRYEKQSKLFMILTILGVLLNFTITYTLLTQFNLSILAPIYGSLISSACMFIFLALRYSVNLTAKLNRIHLTQILYFGLQSSATGLLFYLLDWVDRLIIKDLLPMADVGIYSLGYRVAAVINVLLITPFALIWAPIRMEYAKGKDNNIFMQKATSYFTIIGCGLILFAVLYGVELTALVFNNQQFASAAKVFPIIMLSILFYGFQNIVDFGIYLHKKIYFYIIISSLGLIFNVIMNYWLIPHFGYIAAAYISLMTYMLTSGLIYCISNKYHAMKLEWRRICIPILYLSFVYIIINFTSFIDSYTFFKKSLIGIVSILLFFRFWMDKSEFIKIKNLTGI